MALGKAYLHPSTHFAGEHSAAIQLSKMLCHETEDLRSLPKLEWRAGTKTLGYIQDVAIDMHRKTATVGHIAVEKNFSGMGLAKRMVQGFAKMLRDDFGITEIIFDERSRKAEYEVFFEHVLRADRIGTKPNETWRWKWFER